jgi:RND superfamily putative drug exporter
MDRLLVTLARAAATRRWRFVIVWAALAAIAVPFASQVAGALSNGGFDVPGSGSMQLIHARDQAGLGAQPFTLLVVGNDPAATKARFDDVYARVRRSFPQIRFHDAPLSRQGGRVRVVTGFSGVSQNAAFKLANRVVKAVVVSKGPVRTYVLGQASVYATFQHVTEGDLRSAESIGLPIVLVILFALFGAVVASVLPVVLGVVSVVIALAIVRVISAHTEISIYAESMVSMIGLGVAVDYSLFVLARFREELAAGVAREDAVVRAMRTSGTAVVFSGLTVLVSLGTVLIMPVRAVQSMAAAAMIVVAVAVLAAATLLPALLHLLGPNVDRWRIPIFGTGNPSGGGFWHRTTGAVMRRPLSSFLAATAVLLVMASPVIDLRTANTSLSQLPRGEAVVQGSNELQRAVTGPGQGAVGAVGVLATPLPGQSTASIRPRARALAFRIARDPDIIGRRITLQPVGGAIEIVAPLRIDAEGGTAVNKLVPRIRALAARSPLTGVATVAVGGDSAFQRDLNEEVSNDLPLVIAALLVLAYLVLVLMLRSLVLPLKAVLTNLLSISAAYGVLVAVFEWGWADWTGFHHLGTIGTLTPPLVLAITFGLSMDYEVFLLSRIRERYQLHGDTRRAVAEGVASSARLISSAALIMDAVFSAFVVTGVPAIKEIGLGLAVAIAVDATITRLVLVPATMVLLGDANWYLPHWLDRRLPGVSYEPREAIGS